MLSPGLTTVMRRTFSINVYLQVVAIWLLVLS